MVGIGICLQNDSGAFVLAKTAYFSSLCDGDVGEDVGLHTVVGLLLFRDPINLQG